MAAALCYGSRGGGAQLAFYHQVGAYDTQTLANLAADTLQEVIAAAERGVQWTGAPIIWCCRWWGAAGCSCGEGGQVAGTAEAAWDPDGRRGLRCSRLITWSR
jgi:hypothetical protein